MAGIKITKRVVDDAEPRSTRYTVFDSAIRGFGLRVSPSGQKTWVLEYRPGEGGRRTAKKRITIGAVGDFTPDEARRHADKLRSRVKVGEDPQAAKAEARAAATVADIAEAFITGHLEAKRKAGTRAHYEDILNRIVLPAIGTSKARDVKRADVAKIHLSWRDTPFQANRILAVVGSMYGFAGKKGLVPENCNPARGIEKYREDQRERFLSTMEMERLGAAIREGETVGLPWAINPKKKTKHVAKKKQLTTISEHAAAALRLLVFTGARLREVLHLKWEHIDFERGLLLLPDSKTGRKVIILNAPALAVLNGLAKTGIYVIAGETAGQEDEKPRSDLKRPWAVVARRAGLDGVRLHDLRHSFASFGAGGGMSLPMIGKLLGHKEARTTQRYSHLADDPLRKASNAIGAALASALDGPTKGSNPIIPMKRRMKEL